MDLQYQLKAGNYYLYDMREKPSAVTGERRFKLKTADVAIAFDMHTGEVHQHGNPLRIHSWALTMRRRLRSAGLWDEADDIIVISGPCRWTKSTNACGYAATAAACSSAWPPCPMASCNPAARVPTLSAPGGLRPTL
jgi:hypothetical protein